MLLCTTPLIAHKLKLKYVRTCNGCSAVCAKVLGTRSMTVQLNRDDWYNVAADCPILLKFGTMMRFLRLVFKAESDWRDVAGLKLQLFAISHTRTTAAITHHTLVRFQLHYTNAL